MNKTFLGSVENNQPEQVELPGAAAGILLGQAIIGQLFSAITAGRTLAVPWGQIAIIVLGAYLFSLLTTIVPAVQASRIYPADALRYE